MADESSLAYIFGAQLSEEHRQNCEEWEKGRVRYGGLAQLHARFWGKSMADHEEEWRKAHPPEGQDGDDNMDEGMDGDEGMDERDGSEKDDDIIPGCYLLDLGIQGFQIPQFWIRAEYIRIFDYIEAFFKKPGFPAGRPPCVVITGQPGIGKSIWILYALRRFLAQKMPVILYRRKRCYLFVDEGVHGAPPNYPAFGSDFSIFVPTLVDSDESISGVPEDLVTQDSRHAVIYTTSPCYDRWKRLHKTMRQRCVIMNPWARKEILRAAQGLFRDVDEESINDVFDRFGPTPRLCLEYVKDPESLRTYEKGVGDAISNITTLAELERWFKDSQTLTMKSFSHTICLIRRTGLEVSDDFVVNPMTPTIQSRLANQLRKVEWDEQVKFYTSLARVPEGRGVAGVVFESAGQRRLQNGVALDTIPMVRLNGSSRGGTLPQWYSSHVVLKNQSLEEARQQALIRIRTITIPQCQVFLFLDGQQSSITPNISYIPLKSTQVAFDSFMLLENLLYIFQFTIGKGHDIKPSLITSLEKWSNLPPIGDWRFVFLMEPNQCVVCPQTRCPDLQALQPLSAVLDFP